MAKYKVWQKDNRTFQFTLKEGGAYVNIFNKDCFFTGKENVDAASSIFDIAGNITIASEGTFQATLSSTETATCYRNMLCQVTTIDGDNDRTVYGEFYLDILPRVKE
jgi:hypothetical protein